MYFGEWTCSIHFILAAVAGLTQYFQTKQLMPNKIEPGDSQAQAMATTSKIFPILTFLIGLRLPSALALYWAVSTGMWAAKNAALPAEKRRPTLLRRRWLAA